MMVPITELYVYNDQSKFFKAMRRHFVSKGVVDGTRKMETLIWRWVRQKGYRTPNPEAK
jgi:ABC-type tungstate transport system permease subunit